MNMVTVASDRKLGRHSPLRYPGGKSKLAGFFAELIADLELTNVTYVEPFAGGAGAGLALLQQGVVERLAINDLDAAVYSFWSAIVDHNEELAKLVENATLDLDEWARQRDIYRQADARDVLELGFAFFYLNRTNRSGVLNAGVIGGKTQAGTYRIDARFNKVDLASRIRAIGAVSSAITVTAVDGKRTFEEYSTDPNAFIYIDPPYVEMGGALYLNSFTHRDHSLLAVSINNRARATWLLTYDDAPLIRELYSDRDMFDFELSYSAHRVEKARELLIASDNVSAAILRRRNRAL